MGKRKDVYEKTRSRMKRQYEGSLTVFFSLIFLFILAFLGGLFSLGQRQLMEIEVRRDLDAAGLSVLGEYQQDWSEEYGLYVIRESQVLPGLTFYLEKNKIHGWGVYEVDQLNITQTDTLQNPEVLEGQILSFMKERGWLDFAEEMAEVLLQVQKSEKDMEEKTDISELEQLEWVQTLYAQLVTDLEGIQNNGSRNPYSMNHLLEENPSYMSLKEAIEKAEPAEADISIMEKAYYELDQVEFLCEDAVKIGGELEQAMLKVKNQEVLPITVTEIHEYQRIWKENQALCDKASNTIQAWLEAFQGEDGQTKAELQAEAVSAVNHLSQYDRSIQLPYEYKEAAAVWDFKKLIAYFKGYPAEASEVAPDAEKDLQLAEERDDASLNMSDIEIDASFRDLFLMTEYALGTFQNFEEAVGTQQGRQSYNLRGETKRNRFFNNEVEYLIVGKGNEYKNVDGTRQRLILLRTMLNMAYLLSDGSKRAEIEALASMTGGILLPGLGNSLAFGMILTIWSWGEAIADYQSLAQGGNIPLWKDSSSWQTDLSSIMSMTLPDTGQEKKEGFDYGQYLRLLLYTVGQEEMLLRIQNLLYLNHQKQSLNEMVTGFSFGGNAYKGGVELSFSGKYNYEIFG